MLDQKQCLARWSSCVAAVILASSAAAQDVPATQSEDAEGAGRLEQVIVTAQRRSESLQEVPIAVTALSGDALVSMGVASTEDLAVAVPGVTFTHQLITAAPAIRGIGQSNGAPGDEPPTAIYVDGVYLAIAQAAFFSFNNVERIEVLKGPQGTLFGRNAAAGVVNIQTKTPTHTPSLDASVGYGSYDTKEAKLYATSGITDALAADLAIQWSDQGEGWGTNLFDGSDVFKSRDYAVRGKLLWTPADSTTVTLATDYGDSRSDIGIAQHIVQGARGTGGNGFPGFYDIDSNTPTGIEYHQWGASATLEQDLRWSKFKSISAYRSFLARTRLDGDATRAAAQDILFRNPATMLTQEFQLLSPDSSAVTWIAGAFYLDAKAGHDPLKIANVTTLVGVQSTESLSGFAQATVPLGGRTNVTAGARYTQDWQRIRGGNYTYVSHSFENDGALRSPPGAIHQKADFGKATYKLVVDQQLARDVLGYVSYSRGFKGGLFNTASPAAPPVNPQVVDQYEIGFKSEFFDQALRVNLSAFVGEISGVQLQSINASGLTTLLNAASQETKGFDLDVATALARNFTLSMGLSYIDAEYESFPNAPLFTPNPTALCSPAGLTGNCQSRFDASGNRAILTPEWAGNIAATYRIESARGDVDLSATYAYVGSFYWMPDNRLEQPAYRMINASLLWTAPDGGYDVRLWGRNLLDEKIYLYGNEKTAGDIGAPDAPRSVGITASIHF